MLISFIRSVTHELTAAFNPGEWASLTRKLRQSNRQSLLAAFRTLLPQMVIYYVLLSPPVAAPLYDLMLFHPTVTGPYDAHAIVGIKIENVFFRSSNGKLLHGWYMHANGTGEASGGREAHRNSDLGGKQVVLFSHGNGGNLTNRIPLIAMFLKDGVSVFIYDYQGYGRSEGRPGLATIIDDGNAAFNWLIAEQGYEEREVILFGESLGTGVSCQLAARRQKAQVEAASAAAAQRRVGQMQVGGIILQSAYSSLADLACQKILWLRLYPRSLFKEQLDNAEVLARPHAPLLLVHGDKDRLIPVSHSERIYSEALEPKTFVRLPDAGHNDIYDVDFEQYSAAVRKFLWAIKNQKVDSFRRQACMRNSFASVH